MKIDRASILFSVKRFITAMIAFAVAVGLAQPYWCVITCCIIVNPMTGAVRGKPAYRLIGTVCGGLMVRLLGKGQELFPRSALRKCVGGGTRRLMRQPLGRFRLCKVIPSL